jgi:putative transposase
MCWHFTINEAAEGRRLKWFSVVDEFARECLPLEVERRTTARNVVTKTVICGAYARNAIVWK